MLRAALRGARLAPAASLARTPLSARSAFTPLLPLLATRRPLASAAAAAPPFVLLCHVRVAPGMLDDHLAWAREIDGIVEDSECGNGTRFTHRPTPETPPPPSWLVHL